jgi:hypothetical protein
VPLHSDFVFFGRTESIFNVQTVGSPERKAAAERYPSILMGLQTFLSGGNFTTEKAVAIVTDMIRLETEFDPENVGPPINIVALSKLRSPAISTLPK